MDILLVHGAWHDRTCWRAFQDALAARGRVARAFDLPGHGQRRLRPWSTGLNRYVEATQAEIDQFDEPPLVVAHSMGGGVATAAAERSPRSVAGILFVAAFVPQDGDSLGGLSARLRQAGTVSLHPFGGTVTVNEGAGVDMFYHDCDDAPSWAAKLQPQPLRPSFKRIHVTPDGFGSVPTHYVRALQDRCLPVGFQTEMARAAHADEIVDLESSHSPFLSMPRELANVVERFAQRLAATPARGA